MHKIVQKVQKSMLSFKLKSGMHIESKLTNRSLIGLG